MTITNTLAPRPNLMPPPGTMSAPTRGPLTLVASGSQIWDDQHERWLTVEAVKGCDFWPHPQMCVVFRFDVRWEHLPLSAERWIRHPVAGAS